uniref:non-specific serine/threonine protein kinase n=1 Tax=Caenorhabditis japonica TaxID=281687 RepID=A0A8R1ISM2_CAEJA
MMDKEAADLVKIMLKVNPVERADVKQIIKHGWFKIDLPFYLFPESENESSIVDIDAVQSVAEKYTVKEEDVTAVLLAEDHHHVLSIAYRLEVNHKRNADESSQKAKDEFWEIGRRMKLGNEEVQLTRKPNVGRKILEGLQKDQKKVTWNLGIRACSDPVDTMNHVFMRLKGADMEWKVLNMYHIIARCKPTVTNPDPTRVSLQLFAIDKSKNWISVGFQSDD